MKKIFTLVAATLLTANVMAADEIIFSAQVNQSAVTEGVSFTEDNTDFSFNCATSQTTIMAGCTMYSTAVTGNLGRFIWHPNTTAPADYFFTIVSNSVVYKITFAKAIQAGDIISATIKGNNSSAKEEKLCFQQTEVTSVPTEEADRSTVSIAASVGKDGQTASYTVQAGDAAVIGATTLYVYRGNATGTYFDNLVITRPDASRAVSDLTAVKENIVLTTTGATTYTLAKGVDYTTSSTGAFTFSSDNTAVATVDAATGQITAVANGAAVITAVQAEDANYREGTVKFNVLVAPQLDAAIVTPVEALDLTNATTAANQIKVTWKNDELPTKGNDGTDNYIVFSAYNAYQSAITGQLKWSAVPNNGDKTGGGSGVGKWDAPSGSVFKGNTAYNIEYEEDGTTEKGSRYATVNASRDYTKYSYRVKGASKAQFLVNPSGTGRNMYMEAFEMTGNTPAQTPSAAVSFSTKGLNIASLELDKSKEYLLTVVRLDSDANNSNLYEVALFYDSSIDIDIPTGIQTVNVAAPAKADDAWYTISGQRVSQPTKGLYIHNGKKYVVK